MPLRVWATPEEHICWHFPGDSIILVPVDLDQYNRVEDLYRHPALYDIPLANAQIRSWHPQSGLGVRPNRSRGQAPRPQSWINPAVDQQAAPVGAPDLRCSVKDAPCLMRIECHQHQVGSLLKLGWP